MKSSLFIRTAIVSVLAACMLVGPASAADGTGAPELLITGPFDEVPSIDAVEDVEVRYAVLPVVDIDPTADTLPDAGGLDPLPEPYELGEAEGGPEPEVTDIVAVTGDLPDLPLPEEPTRVLYYSLGGEGFDPTVIRNFGLEQDPAAAALERVLTKAVDQAADKAVQPLTPAPL